MNATTVRENLPNQRLMSIDALRGFDMFWIVGAGGIVTALNAMNENRTTKLLAQQLTHVKWEGFQFYDLIFPLFLFIVGLSIVFSLDKVTPDGYGRAIGRILLRSLLLFTIGVFYYGGLSKPWPEVQLGGVLHRIAACYLGAALVYLFIRKWQAIASIIGLLLVGYWALMTFIAIPDFMLEKKEVDRIAKEIGSDAPMAIARSVEGRIRGSYAEGRNLCNFLDFLFLPGTKAQRYYINEGLLSTLPAIGLCLGGVLAGLLFKNNSIVPNRKVILLIGAGITAIVLGWLWSYQFPIIKRIWTSSFILFAGGWCALSMALFYWIVDIQQWKSWCQPFVWIGCNALTIYVVAKIVSFKSLAEYFVGGDIKEYFDSRTTGLGSLVVAAVSLLLVLLLARYLYKRQIFIRV